MVYHPLIFLYLSLYLYLRIMGRTNVIQVPIAPVSNLSFTCKVLDNIIYHYTDSSTDVLQFGYKIIFIYNYLYHFIIRDNVLLS